MPLLRLGRSILSKPNKTYATVAKSGPTMPQSVLGQPLQRHSLSPPTGYLRDGFCHSPPSDFGNHSIAGILTPEFIQFTASRGNDLASIGLKGGCKWCLCVRRWKEVLDAFRRGEVGPNAVPKVVLGATGERAIHGGVTAQELKEWEAR